MDEQQLAQLVQEVAGYLQQGASPEEVAQALVQQGVPKEAVQQVIQMAMQGMQGGEQGMQGGSILEQLAAEDPESLMMIIQEWESLAPEEKEQIMSALSGSGQPQEQAPQQPQGSGMF